MQGIELFLHNNLMITAAKLSVSLGGFWRWRWLKVEGVAPLAACAI